MRANGLPVVIAVLALLFVPALAPSAQFIYRDTGRMHEPNKRFVASELSQGRLAEWNPLTGLGTPMVAGSVDAVLHPFNLFLVALPVGLALKGWILASFVAAALGARAWGRALGLGDEAATLGGLVFALSGPLVSSSDNVTYLTSYALLPWFFAALHAFLSEGGPARLALVMLASFVTAAGGDPQSWGLAVLATVPYALWVHGGGDRRRALRRGWGSVLAAIAGAAPAVLPLLAWLPETRRAVAPDPVELTLWNLSPRRLPELFLPGLFRTDPREPWSPVFEHFCGAGADVMPWFLSIYVGAGALALAVLGALRRRWALWLLATAALFTWAAFGSRAGFGQLALHVPVVRGFRYWEKLAVWPALAVALAAAGGLDAFLKDGIAEGARLARAAGIASGGLLALAAAAAVPGLVGGVVGGEALGALLGENLAGGALHAGAILAILAVVAWGTARGRIGGAAGWALAGVVIVDLVGANVGAYVVGEAPPLAPPPLAARGAGAPEAIVTAFKMRQDRWRERGTVLSTWDWGRRTLEPTWNVGAGVRNFRDYQGLPGRRHRTVNLALAETSSWSVTGLWGIAGIVVPEAPELAERAGLKPPFVTLASDPELPAWVVALPHRPRAYLAGEVVAVDEESAFAFALAGGTPGRTVVEGPVPAGAAAGRGAVDVLLDQPGRVDLSVRAESPGLLVLNDAFAPGWTAEVDGRPAAIHRANYLVRGVWLEPGAHGVRFEYRTPGLRLGLVVALGVAAALAAWVAARRFARPR